MIAPSPFNDIMLLKFPKYLIFFSGSTDIHDTVKLSPNKNSVNVRVTLLITRF